MSALHSLSWWLYRLALSILMLVAAPVLLARRGGLRHYRPTLAGRLALQLGEPATGRPPLWIHAVSVGEVGVAATLIATLPADLPLVVTTVTPTGQAEAHKRLASRAEVGYLPFDLAAPVERFMRRYRPAALVLVEGDYWPYLLHICQRRGMAVAVVNGRLSDRAFGRQQRLGRINQLFHASVDRFGMQTDDDRRRLIALGTEANRVVVTGNIKFDAEPPAAKLELHAALRHLAAGREILVAGSTMAGEDEQVLDSFVQLGSERAMLVLAPRHPERWDDVARLLVARRLVHLRRSQLDLDRPPQTRPEVVLLDSLGELASTYGLAASAFIGGTLVPTGGHNPLEPAHHAVPVVIGPSMFNFKQMAEDFDRAEAWTRVADSAQLASVWRSVLDEPEAARAIGLRGQRLIELNRGAVERSRELLMPMLQPLLDDVRSSNEA